MLPTAFWFVIMFIIQLLTTSLLTGIIWFVQIVHYPLFLLIPQDRLQEYAAAHQRKTSRLVLPLMVAEGLTGIWLTIWAYRNFSFGLFLLAFFLLVVIWVFTINTIMPIHKKLAHDPHPEEIKHLINVNWVRTWAWSFRFFLLLGFVFYSLSVRFLYYLLREL